MHSTEAEEPVYEEVRDGWRETFETISFVVFLVLMLKAFVAEAYVIPTGSMATTLLGDHMYLTLPTLPAEVPRQCFQWWPEPRTECRRWWQKMLQLEGCCPNCQYVVSNPAESVDGGDKVLVLKPIYDLFKPERHDTVVFKYPLGPQKDFGAYNYIKRLWGLPGEKLAIHGGDVYLVDKAGKLNIIRKATRQDAPHASPRERQFAAESCPPESAQPRLEACQRTLGNSGCSADCLGASRWWPQSGDSHPEGRA